MPAQIHQMEEDAIAAALKSSLSTGENGAGISPASFDGLRRAAVLIPFFRVGDNWHILFTRRTEHVETHKGQVAFPGGSADPSDRNAQETALRETFEEIGIPPRSVRILGQMKELATNSRFLVTPVVGVIEWPAPHKIHEAEVSRVFDVPLAWLAKEENYEIRPYERLNGTREHVVFFREYDGEIIWGVTGRLVKNLIDILKQ